MIETELKNLTRNDVLKAVRRIFNSEVDFIGHNIKYDWLVLRRSGITIKRMHFDTMLAAYDCHGDWPFFNLPYVCKRYLGKDIKPYSDLVSDGSTFLDLPLKEMVNHACQDADMTRRLYPVLLAQLQKRGITEQFLNHTMGHLQRLAQRYVGLPPAAMIRRRRLQEAAQRLRAEPETSLAALAAELGYTDHAHLANEFRAVLGFTPSAYRRRLTPTDAPAGDGSTPPAGAGPD